MARAKRRKFSVGDVIRVPAGLVLIYVSILLIIKCVGTFELSPVPVIVLVMGCLVSLLFAVIGIAMSAGPFAPGMCEKNDRDREHSAALAGGTGKEGILKKDKGSRTAYPKLLTSAEACRIAKSILEEKYPGEEARLCCVYTSAMDCGTVLGEEGVSGGWHVDFYLPESKKAVLVRLARGRARISEKPWEITRKSPVEYVFALYGADPDSPEPPALPGSLINSPDIFRITREALSGAVDPELEEYYSPVMVCFPAVYIRYLQDEKSRAALKFPAAPDNAAAVICSSDELYEEDSYLFYIGAESGEILGRHAFRYPNLFYFGNSADW